MMLDQHALYGDELTVDMASNEDLRLRVPGNPKGASCNGLPEVAGCELEQLSISLGHVTLDQTPYAPCARPANLLNKCAGVHERIILGLAMYTLLRLASKDVRPLPPLQLLHKPSSACCCCLFAYILHRAGGAPALNAIQ